jgi:hypothetical protein
LAVLLRLIFSQSGLRKYSLCLSSFGISKVHFFPIDAKVEKNSIKSKLFIKKGVICHETAHRARSALGKIVPRRAIYCCKLQKKLHE